MISNEQIRSYRSTFSIYDLLLMDGIAHYLFDFLTHYELLFFFSKLISNQMTNVLKKFNVNSILSLKILNHLKTFLNIFGFQFPKFMCCLNKANAVIAGGFALAMFSGKLFDSSDIDIYIPAISDRKYKKKLFASGLIEYLEKIGYVKSNTVIINDPSKTFFEFVNNNLKRKVQIFFHLYYGNEYYLNRPLDYCAGHSVIEDYDFRIGMCYIKRSERNNFLVFHCTHIKDVMEKKMKLNPTCPNLIDLEQFKLAIFERLIKYKSRGYELCESIDTFIPMFTQKFVEFEASLNNIV